MPNLDFSVAEEVRFGNTEALAVMFGNTLVCEKPVIPSGLMAAYNFNEASGPVIDYSGNGRSVTLSSPSTQRVATAQEGVGAAAGGMVLAGQSSGVDMVPYNETDSRSMTFWAYLPTDGVWSVRWQVSSADIGAFGVYNLSLLRARFRKGGVLYNIDAASSMPINTWTHFGIAYDAITGTGELYINGSLVGSTTDPGPGPLDDADFIDIAADSGNSFIVDSLRNYSKAITLEEVVADMNTPVGS